MADFEILSKKEAKDKGLEVNEGQIWRLNNETGKLSRFFKNYKKDVKDLWTKLTKKEAKNLGLEVDKGQVWKKNSTTGVVKKIGQDLGKVPESMTATQRKGKPHKARGGAIKKYAHGGGVSSGHQLTYKRK